MRIEYSHLVKNPIKVGNFTGFYQRVADHMVGSTKRKINQGIRPANAPLTVAVKKGSKTLRDRGDLIGSIASRATPNEASVGTNKIYARIQHFGGTIKAKKTWLFIPAGYETRRLQRKYSFAAGELIKKMRADGYNVWFQVKGNKGVVMAEKKLKRHRRDGAGKIIHKSFVLFILKKAVTIPARPFLTIDELDRKVIMRMARQELGVEG